MFNAIFGMCKDIRTYQQKEREARRKDTQTLKQIASRLELDTPRYPLSNEAASEPETEEQQQGRYDTEFAKFLQRQQQQQQALEHPDTLPLQARVPTHSQSCPSAADKYASDWWSDLIGSFYDPSGTGGSRPVGATRSDDEDVGRDEDDDE